MKNLITKVKEMKGFYNNSFLGNHLQRVENRKERKRLAEEAKKRAIQTQLQKGRLAVVLLLGAIMSSFFFYSPDEFASNIEAYPWVFVIPALAYLGFKAFLTSLKVILTMLFYGLLIWIFGIYAMIYVFIALVLLGFAGSLLIETAVGFFVAGIFREFVAPIFDIDIDFDGDFFDIDLFD
jgi:hypothetical protein